MQPNVEHLVGNETRGLARAFKPLVGFVRALERGRLDLFAPERIVDRFHTTVESVVQNIPSHAVTTGLIALVRDDAFWNGAAARTGLTPRSDAFCDYFKTLNAQWPFASTILIMRSRYLRRGMFSDYLRAVGLLQRATSARRERRAEWLRQATIPIIESLYYEMTAIAYAADCLQRGASLKAKRGGHQLREVARSLPCVFTGEEGRIRNAAAHVDRWRYSHASDTVRLTDTNWSEDLSTAELLTQLRSLLHDSVLPLQVIARLHGPEARHWLRALLTQEATSSLGVLVADYNKTAHELHRLGWRPATDASVTSHP